MKKAIVLGFTIVLMTACGREEKSHAVVRAPLIATIGAHQVSIPDTPDIQQALFQPAEQPLDAFAKGVLCRHVAEDPLPRGCEEFRGLPVHAEGVIFYLRPKASKFQFLKEKPVAHAPGATPLIRLRVYNRVLMSSGPGFNEEYEIGRLQTSLDWPSLVTTSRKWPIAGCYHDSNANVSSCRV